MISTFLNGRKRHLVGLGLIWLLSICIMNILLPSFAKEVIDIASKAGLYQSYYQTFYESFIERYFTLKEFSVFAITICALILVLANGTLSYFSQSYERWIQNSFYKAISTHLLATVMSAKPAFLQQSSPAYFRSLINQESGNCSSMMLSLFSSATVSTITLLVSAVYIVRESTTILLMFIGFMPFYFLAIRGISENIRTGSKDGIERAVQTQNALDRILLSWRTVIIYSLQGSAIEKYKNSLEDSICISQKVANMQAIFSSRTSTFASLCQFILLAFIARETLYERMTIGSAIALSGVFSSFLSSFRSICQLRNTSRSFQASLERIRQLFASCEVEAKNPQVIADCFNDIVRFEKVSFKIEESILFDGFCYQIQKGEKIQICGPNGSGKSTLVDLITGFQVGDGVIVSPPLTRISVCFPNQNFLPLTIMEHVAAYISTEEETRYFVKLVDAFELNGILDHDPNLLSSGQRQRVSILLALLKKSDLYIFDEALANIDKEARRCIGSIIAESTQGKTVISITHEDSIEESSGRIIKLRRLQRTA